MQRLPQIDPLQPGRPEPKPSQRQALRRAQQQRDRLAGYEQLTELCRLGEVDLAQQLARQNPGWGYQIVDGIVVEQEQDVASNPS
ncbi:MAG: hypothetical protein F6J87_29015 [Spirulina sp. SIO3F2]|nr:hypothetical protein [Spirulina sp. SIO3F2]